MVAPFCDRLIHRRSLELGISGCNGCSCASQVKGADVPLFIYVNTNQRARSHIAQVVGAEHHAVADFMLDTDIHLYRARRLVVRREQTNTAVRTNSLTQEITDVARIGSLEIGWVPSLHEIPERQDLRDDVADVIAIAAEVGTCARATRCDGPGIYRYGLWFAAKTTAGYLVESSGLQTQRSIKQDIVVDYVLEIKADAGTDHSFAVLHWVPGDTQLGRKVKVSLLNSVSKPGESGVDIRIRRQVAIGTPSVAVITQAHIQGKVRLDLPRIAYIKADPVIRSQPACREAQSRLKRVKSLPITEADPIHIPVSTD